MTILTSFASWPQISNPNNPTEFIPQGLVTLVADAIGKMKRDGGNPTTVILGRNAAAKFKELLEMQETRSYCGPASFLGLDIIFAIEDGLFLF